MKGTLLVALCILIATLVQGSGATTLVSDEGFSRHLLQNAEARGESIAIGGEGQGKRSPRLRFSRTTRQLQHMTKID
jgi:hypothetical protein